MTDENKTEDLKEEGAVEQLLNVLGRVVGDADPVAELGELVDEPLARAHMETFGLLGCANEPLVPSPEIKERLLSALKAEDVDEAPAAPLPFVRERSAATDAPVEVASRWPLRLAATVALALLGLSGWQLLRLEQQKQTIARLTDQLRGAQQPVVALAELRDQLEAAQAKLTVITSPGVEVCNLKPVGENPLQPRSRGALFVAADHQHWYLKVVGLNRSPQGRAYQLWFITEAGHRVSAGTFHVEPGERRELSSETMPAGTIAVSITLEPAGGSPQPTGPPVLYGDEVMRIL